MCRFLNDKGREIILYTDNRWEYSKTTTVQSYASPLAAVNEEVKLREDEYTVTNTKILNKAKEMKRQGWEYIMPKPKSSGADWTVKDGRTTWYNGYWINRTKKDKSYEEPKLKDGIYVGDNQTVEVWTTIRRGRPKNPTEIEWLLSKSGGVPPNFTYIEK